MYYNNKRISSIKTEGSIACDVNTLKITSDNINDYFYFKGILNDDKEMDEIEVKTNTDVYLCKQSTDNCDTPLNEEKKQEIIKYVQNELKKITTPYRIHDNISDHVMYVKINITDNICFYLGTKMFVEKLESNKTDNYTQISSNTYTKHLNNVEGYRNNTIYNGVRNAEYNCVPIINLGLIVSTNNDKIYNLSRYPFNHRTLNVHEQDTEPTPTYKKEHRENPPIFYDFTENEIKLIKSVFCDIDAAINGGKNIYIHCNQGEHRSPALLILYLYLRTGISFELIWRYIQQKRNHIKPYNLTLFKTYLQYDNIDVNRATFMSTLYNRRNEFALQSGGSNIYHNYMENKKLYNILM